jgi:hypothetical protein
MRPSGGSRGSIVKNQVMVNDTMMNPINRVALPRGTGMIYRWGRKVFLHGSGFSGIEANSRPGHSMKDWHGACGYVCRDAKKEDLYKIQLISLTNK